MKFQLQDQILVKPDLLFSILCNTQNRKLWLPVFDTLNPKPISKGLILYSTYSFPALQECKEEYVRVVENKEIAVKVTTAKGIWTVYVILIPIDSGTEVTVMAELESQTWLSSIILWMETGKMELFGKEIFERFKKYAESMSFQSVE